jgi:hypothetical protein
VVIDPISRNPPTLVTTPSATCSNFFTNVSAVHEAFR